ncbi:MAG TPA: bifunctional precorrin-2 dehydrogenase/sirohydrochlorin ferrochelatase [Candidatus Binatia bacterium]|jgi:siroheme synthase-like protein
MGYYPIFVNLTGRRCLVIGGGAVAERKVEGLLQAGANVALVSPDLTATLAAWAEDKKITHFARDYRPGDLTGYRFAFVATDDPKVNLAAYHEGRERGVLVNVADDPAHCDFILPSVLRRGELTVAVATDGSSPALSRAIREELEQYFTDDYAVLSRIVAEVRRELRERGSSAGPEIWRRALNGSLRKMLQRGDIEGAKRYLREQVSV